MRPNLQIFVVFLLCACPSSPMGPTTDASTGASTTGASTDATDGATTLATTPTSTGDASTAGPGTGESTTAGGACDPLPEATSDCCCFSLDGNLYADACPASELCPAASIRCSLSDPECPVGGGDAPGEWTVDDAKNLDCILTALRDGAPGALKWSFLDAEAGGQYAIDFLHDLQPDRSAFSRIYEYEDLAFARRDLTRKAIAPADVFAACLASPDVKGKALCLRDITTGDVLDLCLPGG